jgi:hypothetical protein
MTLPVTWAPREPPLPAVAVAGTGDAARRLRAGAAERVAAGADLRATANADWIVVLGAEPDLPWAEGAAYLGWDAGLLLPTTSQPWPPVDLLREAVRRTAGSVAGLVVLLPDRLLVSPMPARPLEPQ